MRKSSSPSYHVLMGDVTGSSQRNATDVAAMVRTVSAQANTRFADAILSPLTVTLGDEFQGVLGTAADTLKVLFFLRETVFKDNLAPLHFSWVFGPIDTPINPKIAHEMIGPALTNARKMLTRKDRARPDIQVDLGNPRQTALMNNVLFALSAIAADWKHKDAALITDLIEGVDISAVAKRHGRDTSSVYRRRETLMIAPYLALKDAATELAALHDEAHAHA